MFKLNSFIEKNSNISGSQLNPSIKTARGSLELLRLAEIPEAVELCNRLPAEAGSDIQNYKSQPLMLTGLSVMHELRYRNINYYARKAGITNIIDLGCGFSPRGLYFKNNTDNNFYGLDLPDVIKAGKIAFNDMNYFAGDITNLNSFRDMLKKVSGKVVIITDSVLQFLTEDELKIAIENISIVLKEHGGVWLTPDFYDEKSFQTIMKSVLEADVFERLQAFFEQVKADMAKQNFKSFDCASTKGFEMLKAEGLTVRELPYVIPEGFDTTMKKLPESLLKSVLNSYKCFTLSYITYSGEKDHKAYIEMIQNKNESFSYSLCLRDNVLVWNLFGRLDTISAPPFLDSYKDSFLAKKPEIRLLLDCENLDYVSSAGLRAFLVLYKEKKEKFGIINANDAVEDVLDKTGLKQLLCKEC